ncbi:hypothetical protein BGZ63DRAFT_400620 [Mariannaea sp. PMI_226]|nr:hypothetical protein BGZ63DRAFT_400620 [Mariannaea sp. PMI_226]
MGPCGSRILKWWYIGQKTPPQAYTRPVAWAAEAQTTDQIKDTTELETDTTAPCRDSKAESSDADSHMKPPMCKDKGPARPAIVASLALPSPHNGALVKQKSAACRGQGIFAAEPLFSGHTIVVEEPAISCIHWRQRGGKRTIGDVWNRLSAERRNELGTSFSKLSAIPIEGNASRRDRKKLETFVQEYGFRDSGLSNAHIYHIGSHINHACLQCANAEFWINSEHPYNITIRLTKNVDPGMEIFIHYNKEGLVYGCGSCGPRARRAHARKAANGLFG